MNIDMHRTGSTPSVAEHTARLTALTQRKLELLAELDRSIALQQFEPRAFEHGACKVVVTGNIRYSPRKAIFKIILGNGEEVESLLMAVPYRLWPRSVRDEFATIPAHIRRGLERDLIE